MRRTFGGETGTTQVYVDVVVTETGDVVMAGQDVGAGPRAVFGDSDYEYFFTVNEEAKDLLVLHLLKEVFGESDEPTSAFAEWLKQHEIPFETFMF